MMIGKNEIFTNRKSTTMPLPGKDGHHAFLPFIRLLLKWLCLSRSDDKTISRLECCLFNCFTTTDNYISKFFVSQKIPRCLGECINDNWVDASLLAFCRFKETLHNPVRRMLGVSCP